MPIFEKQTSVQKPPLSKGALRPRVVISGYYGFNNLGDELILHVLVEQLKKRNLDVLVLSNTPEETERKYGVRAVSRNQPMAVVNAISQAHLFISGGGGLFQDATGPMSVLYYGGLIGLARFFEIPVCFIGQGLGPLNRPFSKAVTQKALQWSSLVTVRDEASAQLVEELTGERPHLVMDPVWLLDLPSKKPVLNETTPWRVGISLRPWGALSESRIDALAKCLEKLAARSTRKMHFSLLPFQQAHDKPVLELFADKISALGLTDWEMVDPAHLLNVIPQCHLLFGMRFHSLILGILSDVSVFGLVYDPKVRQLIDVLGLEGIDIAEMGALGGDSQVAQLQTYFNHYPEVTLTRLRQGAYRNFEVLDELLSRQNFSEFVLEVAPPPDLADYAKANYEL
ncbi:MAG: polysaccharide pyruvyl transferase CsaB [Vampirovibrionales bacterium]|nr:polysaccharide pyruvyl transferase CsaB [Vampirovibrionales bacterium]